MADVFKVEGSVSLDTSSFNNEVDKAAQAGKQLASDISEQSNAIKNSLGSAFPVSIGNILSDIAKEAGRAAVEFVSDSISIASSLEEVQNVVDVTFGDGAAQLEQWASNARTQFGLTELQAKQYASTMGAMLKSMGMTESQVYDMSTSMAGLAADMASFYNLDFDTAFAKIRSGISGETEPLKQLGINLSVANLEAYALSQGITKAYESMTQAEQAALRYNYMLSVTADAQGDFARTSDSYANNLRMLETNFDSLKASIGEAFLPVINDVITALNSLFNNEQSLSEAMASADASFAENANSIAMQNIKANALIDTLDRLSQSENMTEAEAAQWNAAVRELIAIYPGLSEMIGNNTGEFNTSIEAIRNETTALKENALEKAKIAAMQTKVNAYADAIAKAADKEIQYNMDRAAWLDLENQRWEMANKIAEQIGIERDVIDAAYKDYSMLDMNTPGLSNLDETNIELIRQYNALTGACATSSAAVWELGLSLEEANAQVAQAESEVEQTRSALEAMGEAAQNAGDGVGSGGGVSTSIEDMTDNTKDFTSTLKDLQKEGENVQKMFDEIEKYKLNNLENIRKKVEGVYDSFEKVGRVRKQSGKKMLGNNENQVKQLERFTDAYKKLQEAGASDQLMAEFDYSTESIGQMEAILKDIDSGKRSIEDYNTSISNLQTKQDEVATMLANTSENVDTTLANMQTAAEQASADLTNKMNSIVADAAAMQASVTTAGDTATGAVNTLQTAGDALGLSTWEPTLDAEDNATSIINAVKSALGILDGKSATVKIYTERVEGGKPHATGLDYVPYDEYAARLHKGEAVLTKAEADNWRKGTKAYQTDQPITINLTVNGVSSNPYEIASEVKHALELLRWQG